ncbi:hypothetical protein V1478_014634, partial [Vespula squamosa]
MPRGVLIMTSRKALVSVAGVAVTAGARVRRAQPPPASPRESPPFTSTRRRWRVEADGEEEGGAYASRSWGWIYGECFMVPPVGKHLRVNSSVRWENSSLIFAILRGPVSPFVTLPQCTSLLPRCILHFIGVSAYSSCENFVSDNHSSSDYVIDYELSLSYISRKEEREKTFTRYSDTPTAGFRMPPSSHVFLRYASRIDASVARRQRVSSASYRQLKMIGD